MAKTEKNKFLNTAKSDREGGRTVGSGRVATIIEQLNTFLSINRLNWLSPLFTRGWVFLCASVEADAWA